MRTFLEECSDDFDMAVPDSLDERGDAGGIWVGQKYRVMISDSAAVLGHQRVPLSSMSRGAASARAARAAARSPCEQAFQSGETIWETCGDCVGRGMGKDTNEQDSLCTGAVGKLARKKSDRGKSRSIL